MPFPLCPHSRRRHRRSHVAASKLLAHTLLGLLGQNSRYIRIGAQKSSTCTSQSRSPVSCPCFTPPLLEGIQPHLSEAKQAVSEGIQPTRATRAIGLLADPVSALKGIHLL
ncbi:hypothetical protein D1007_58609 [Hordeum vulgare]|nr:hypothetical protein D1007_58609 [Hordeum vulgare]